MSAFDAKCSGDDGAKTGAVTVVQRIVQMWTELLEQNKGPMLFGEFTIADAFYAPVCMRIKNYALPVPGVPSYRPLKGRY